MAKGRHSLAKLHALYGRNYLRLLPLVPETVSQGQHWHLNLAPNVELGFCLLEQTRYTQVLQIQRWLPSSAWLTLPTMSVRMYHDAQLAEVLSGQQISGLWPVYDWKTAKLLLARDRFQTNLFLAEILECLAPHRLKSMAAVVRE
ncbi:MULTISPECIES: DUF1249 domain-containing protein [Ferrimonas]|uniref:DUF1249 domain-containing protein n=1 Tax=Ferrimonas TaxID=44011 RepID=UPI0004276B4E|nr:MULTISPECIES: DUF1249 domain-containing protein [Ferrimonas]USD37055.1 DUF1249 domain-containing protein [Ferrimonas sp. SCSIO 43195]